MLAPTTPPSQPSEPTTASASPSPPTSTTASPSASITQAISSATPPSPTAATAATQAAATPASQPTTPTTSSRNSPAAETATTPPSTTPSRLLSPGFILLVFLNFALGFGYFLSSSVSASFAQAEFAATGASSGAASGIFLIGSCVALLILAASQPRGLGTWLGGSLLAWVGLSGAYFFASSLSFFLVLRFFHGLAFGLAANVSILLALALIPPRRRGFGLGIYAEALCLAGAAGPAVGLYFLRINDFVGAFVSLVFSALLTLGLFLFFKKKEALPALLTPPPPPAAPPSLRGFFKNIFAGLAGIYALTLLFALCYSAILAFGLGYFAGLAGGAAFFPLYALASFVARPILGLAFDKFGLSVLGLCLASFAACFVCLASASLVPATFVPAALILAALFAGLGYGAFYSLGQAGAIRAAGPGQDQNGRRSMFYFLILDLGIGLGPIFWGLALGWVGIGGVFWICAGICLGGLWLLRMIKLAPPDAAANTQPRA